MIHFKHLIFLLISMVSIHGMAQNATSSSIMGKVVDSKGEAIIGATVAALHNPSGSISGNTTRKDGSFNLPSVRIGGPYTLTISFIGYKTQKLENIYLSLGQVFEANFVLIENTVDLATAEVVVEKNSILNDKRTGASTTISKEQLQTLPTINRSLYDFLRLTPQGRSSSVASTAGAGISFAGQDSRYNNLTIDGSVFNNSFGLASAPGGQTNSTPISLDAIQEIQVNLAPFDIRYNGFTGAGINTVTRSGTNTIEASIFRNSRNESMVGRYAGDNTVTPNKFSVNQTGFRLGAPIIKNKLFIFVNGEFERRSDPATQYLAARSGVSGANVTRVTASSLDSLHSFLMNKYGYDAGGYENYALLTESNKFLAKIDWNVNDKNRVSVRYNSLYSKRDVPMSNSGVISGNRSNNTDALGFSNANYIINNNLTSVIAELNTNIGNSMTNSVQIGYTAMRDFRSSNNATPFPFVDILSGGKTYTSFGY
ncbi:MAG: carboxypeptidase regulatory-like domain-containing protein, partial [Bacteroidetes bacterium]|nr:carboxypeptidase regulatory-like domain-containing protein [Bacteroidota bacterium]